MEFDEIIQLYTQGKSIRGIRKICGYSINKISKIIHDNNIIVISNIEKNTYFVSHY